MKVWNLYGSGTTSLKVALHDDGTYSIAFIAKRLGRKTPRRRGNNGEKFVLYGIEQVLPFEIDIGGGLKSRPKLVISLGGRVKQKDLRRLAVDVVKRYGAHYARFGSSQKKGSHSGGAEEEVRNGNSVGQDQEPARNPSESHPEGD